MASAKKGGDTFKIVLVGDGAVGKSCLLHTYIRGRFPHDYVPTCFGLEEVSVIVDGKLTTVQFTDTAGQEEYSRLRVLSYHGADVFMICASVASPSSLDNIFSKWVPEISFHEPSALKVIFGTKTDLRSSCSSTWATTDGEACAAKAGCKYFECSALTQAGLHAAFNAAIAAAYDPDHYKAHQLKKKKPTTTPQAPCMPPVPKAPEFEVQTSLYAEHLDRTLFGEDGDTCIVVEGRALLAHSVVLTCASDYFRRLFMILEHEKQTATSIPLAMRKRAQSKLEHATEKKGDQDENSDAVVDIPTEETAIIPEYLTCPICADCLRAPIVQCHNGHSFCRDCLKDWMHRKSTCAICRSDLPAAVDDLPRNRGLESAVCEWLKSPEGVKAAHSPVRPKWPPLRSHKILKDALTTPSQIEAAMQSVNAGPLDTSLVSVVLVMDDSISQTGLQLALRFIVTGMLPRKLTSPGLDALNRLAVLMECDELSRAVCNIRDGDEDLNPSIGTWLNDRFANDLKLSHFLNPALSDARVCLPGGVPIPVHTCIIKATCPTLAALFDPHTHTYACDSSDDITREDFIAFLEYLYTAHTPTSPVDHVKLLHLAHKYQVLRLTTLVEIAFSKDLDKSYLESFQKCEIDLVQLMYKARAYGAVQLSKFLIHFIAANYGPMSEKPEFHLLKGEDLAYVEKNRWPPLEYVTALKEYEEAVRKYEKKDTCVVQ